MAASCIPWMKWNGNDNAKGLDAESSFRGNPIFQKILSADFVFHQTGFGLVFKG
ncbi:hypothetical protein HMPREF1326_00961 [Akkermansia sp. KLE1605]|nr:hypothetical protein HMPREF1326_00961 [Akkermansia sp. KLE1605]